MTQTTVVNIRGLDRTEYDVYIGRQNKRYGLQGSPFANPFKMKNQSEAERERVIAEYEQYLRRTMVVLALCRAQLPGKRLACWCAPKACHGDVLAKVADMSDDEFTAWMRGDT